VLKRRAKKFHKRAFFPGLRKELWNGSLQQDHHRTFTNFWKVLKVGYYFFPETFDDEKVCCWTWITKSL
jgi:hypothetical protein